MMVENAGKRSTNMLKIHLKTILVNNKSKISFRMDFFIKSNIGIFRHSTAVLH